MTCDHPRNRNRDTQDRAKYIDKIMKDVLFHNPDKGTFPALESYTYTLRILSGEFLCYSH